MRKVLCFKVICLPLLMLGLLFNNQLSAVSETTKELETTEIEQELSQIKSEQIQLNNNYNFLKILLISASGLIIIQFILLYFSNKKQEQMQNHTNLLIADLENKIQRIDSKIKENKEQNEQQYKTLLTLQETSDDDNEQDKNEINNKLTNTESLVNKNETYFSEPDYQLSAENLVYEYNRNPNFVPNQAIPVGETEASLKKRRSGANDAVELQKNAQGEFFILTDIAVENYLIPQRNLRLNKYKYDTLQAVFTCQGYQEGYSQEFTLKKPAKVSPTYPGKWVVIELGELRF